MSSPLSQSHGRKKSVLISSSPKPTDLRKSSAPTSVPSTLYTRTLTTAGTNRSVSSPKTMIATMKNTSNGGSSPPIKQEVFKNTKTVPLFTRLSTTHQNPFKSEPVILKETAHVTAKKEEQGGEFDLSQSNWTARSPSPKKTQQQQSQSQSPEASVGEQKSKSSANKKLSSHQSSSSRPRSPKLHTARRSEETIQKKKTATANNGNDNKNKNGEVASSLSSSASPPAHHQHQQATRKAKSAIVASSSVIIPSPTGRVSSPRNLVDHQNNKNCIKSGRQQQRSASPLNDDELTPVSPFARSKLAFPPPGKKKTKDKDDDHDDENNETTTDLLNEINQAMIDQQSEKLQELEQEEETKRSRIAENEEERERLQLQNTQLQEYVKEKEKERERTEKERREEEEEQQAALTLRKKKEEEEQLQLHQQQEEAEKQKKVKEAEEQQKEKEKEAAANQKTKANGDDTDDDEEKLTGEELREKRLEFLGRMRAPTMFASSSPPGAKSASSLVMQASMQVGDSDYKCKEYMEKFDEDELLDFLTLFNVAPPIIHVLCRHYHYTGAEFVDENFIDDCISSDVRKEFEISDLQMRAFVKIYRRFLGNSDLDDFDDCDQELDVFYDRDRNSIENLSIDELASFLAENKVSSSLIDAIQKQMLGGQEFVDDLFMKEAFSDQVKLENKLTPLHVKSFTKKHQELLAIGKTG